MPSRATGWSGFSAVLLLVLPVLMVTSPSTPEPAAYTEAAPTAMVEVALQAPPEPKRVLFVASGVDPLLNDEPARVYAETQSPEPTSVAHVAARNVATSSAVAAPVVRANVVAPAEIPVQTGSAQRLSRDEVYALTEEMSGSADWASWATRVIMCESGGQVNAVSSGGHYGLAQVASVHPYDFSRMVSEPRYAIQAMINIYQSSGPAAWSCK